MLSGDVTDEDFNEAVADATVAEWGGVDVWICNAGISPVVAGPRETDPAVWREILDVNLTGAFLGARAAARVMGDGGRLIFTGSVLGERPRAGSAAYSASKAGLVGLAKGLALDLAPAGITVNVVAPGLVRLAARRTRGRTSPSSAASVLEHTAQRRWGAADRSRRRVPVPRVRRVGVRHRHRAQRRRRLPARMSESSGSRARHRDHAGAGASDARVAARVLGAASRRREPDTDVVLSDVSEASLAATRRRAAERRGAVETVLADVSDIARGRSRRRAAPSSASAGSTC